MIRSSAIFLLCSLINSSILLGIDDLPYHAPDPELQVQRIDHSEKESFLSVRADAQGRLFVGGRENLSVLDIDATGKLLPRKVLLTLPPDSWINDIAIRGNDLYLMTVSALYLVPNGRIERSGLQAQRLIWGVPLGHVHQCFHALAWGPEGDLYFTMGDPLWYYGDFTRADHWGHWNFYSPAGLTQPREWKATPYTGAGGIFRCHPDGTGFQVVARGLRNPCGLTVDRHWNLFSNENDHEGMPAEYVPGKILHVVPGSFYGWPRGWTLQKTPDRFDLLPSLADDLGRMVPVGQTYYDDDFLPDRYRNSLVVARWCTRQITYYPLQRSGDSFHAQEKILLQGRDLARPMGVCVGRGGSIWATISYMEQNEGSPIYQSDLILITRKDDQEKTPPLTDPTQLSPQELVNDLSHSPWSRQELIYQELLRRGTKSNSAIAEKLNSDSLREDDPVLIPLIWLYASTQTPEARELTTAWISHESLELREAALRALIQFFPDPQTARSCLSALRSGTGITDPPSPPLQLVALQGLADPRIAPDFPAEVLGVSETALTQPFIRHLAAQLIATRAPLDRLERMSLSTDPGQRLLGLLATGFRLTLPRPTEELPLQIPLTDWRLPENYQIQFADGKENLKTRSPRIGLFTLSEAWKGAPHSSDQEHLFKILQQRLEDKDERIRVQAANFLNWLNDPRSSSQVETVLRRRDESRLSSAPLKHLNKFWVLGPFPDQGKGLETSHPPEQEAVNLDARYKVGDQSRTWQMAEAPSLLSFRKIFGESPDSSYYAYIRIDSMTRQLMQLFVGSDDGVRIWLNGREVWKNAITRAALPLQDGVTFELQQGTNDLLIRINNIADDCGMHLHVRTFHPFSEVLPEKLGLESLASRLKEAANSPDAQKLDPVFATINWEQEILKGDHERGRKLFSAMGLGCAKCHAIDQSASENGGPSLAEAAKRFTLPHLIESILLPSKQVSPVFKATLIVTKEGRTFTGLVVGETGEKLDLLLTDGMRLTIPRADIEDRKLQETSPMPTGLVRTPDELRDLVNFLLHESSAK